MEIDVKILDGEKSDGIIKCTIAGWTGIVYRVPSSRLDRACRLKHVHKKGIYILFDVRGRVHTKASDCLSSDLLKDRNGDWTCAVLVISTDGIVERNLDRLAELIDGCFKGSADAAREEMIRRTLNEKEKPDGDEIKEFVSNTRCILSVLGFRAF